MDKLFLTTFSTDLKKWKAWLSPESCQEWEQFTVEDSKPYMSPECLPQPWVLTDLVNIRDDEEVESTTCDMTDLLYTYGCWHTLGN